MTEIAPRKIVGGGFGKDILDGLYRYDESTDRWVRIRTVTKSKADKIKARQRKHRRATVFHSIPKMMVRTDRKTKKRYVMRRDDGMGVLY